MAKDILFEIQELSNDPRFIDLTGSKFGLLQVIGYVGRKPGGALWLCSCDCGVLCNRTSYDLRFDVSKSCGCVTRKKGPIKHGESVNSKITPEYKAYLAAKGRCNNSADAVYDYYGGRGIEFRFCSFDDFLSAIGRKPTRNHSIDRIDSDGHYEPGNVRWASKKEQANNRRNSLLVEVNGTKKTLSEWCGHNRSKTEMARSRITRGTHCVQCAIELPKNTKCLHEKTPVDIGVARGQNGWFATVLYR